MSAVKTLIIYDTQDNKTEFEVDKDFTVPTTYFNFLQFTTKLGDFVSMNVSYIKRFDVIYF